jgi:hypothetical protein
VDQIVTTVVVLWIQIVEDGKEKRTGYLGLDEVGSLLAGGWCRSQGRGTEVPRWREDCINLIVFEGRSNL